MSNTNIGPPTYEEWNAQNSGENSTWWESIVSEIPEILNVFWGKETPQIQPPSMPPATTEPKKTNYIPWIIGGISVLVIAVVIYFLFRKK
jgi:hypothetical protein